jgi:hypothetical protein
MTRFVSQADTKTVRAAWWGEDEAVVIKRFSYGDRMKLADLFRKRRDLGEFTLSCLEVGIVSWTLKDEEGEPVELTRGAIDRLWEEDGGFVSDELDAFNPRRTADEQAGFQRAAGDSVTE